MGDVSLLASWSRALIFALLCAVVCTPGALHARVCLVAVGVVEAPSCCATPTCCETESEDGPTLKAAEDECACCLELALDSNDRTPSVTPDAPQAVEAPRMRLLCELAAPPVPARGGLRARAMRARERLRPDAAALLPLRI